MLKILLAIFLFSIWNFSWAKTCAPFSLNKEQKDYLYEILEKKVEKSFEDFFSSHSITLDGNKPVFHLQMKTGYKPRSAESFYHYTMVHFEVTTKKGNHLTTRMPYISWDESEEDSEYKYENGILPLRFFNVIERDQEGTIIDEKCKVTLRESEIKIYNIESGYYKLGFLKFYDEELFTFNY